MMSSRIRSLITWLNTSSHVRSTRCGGLLDGFGGPILLKLNMFGRPLGRARSTAEEAGGGFSVKGRTEERKSSRPEIGGMELLDWKM
eukprot:scaffold7381_cov310-Pinguiococcus_pyrenoidosus.AAC.120